MEVRIYKSMHKFVTHYGVPFHWVQSTGVLRKNKLSLHSFSPFFLSILIYAPPQQGQKHRRSIDSSTYTTLSITRPKWPRCPECPECPECPKRRPNSLTHALRKVPVNSTLAPLVGPLRGASAALRAYSEEGLAAAGTFT